MSNTNTSIAIQRFGRIVDVVCLTWAQHLATHYLESDEHEATPSSSKLTLHVRDFAGPLDGKATHSEDTSSLGRAASIFYDQCKRCVALISPLAAFFFENLPVHIEEVQVSGVQSHSAVAIQKPNNPSSRPTAHFHNMLKLTPVRDYAPMWAEGFVMDPSAPQYGRAQGCQSWASYQRHKMGPTGECTRKFIDFPTEYSVTPPLPLQTNMGMTTASHVWLHAAVMVADEVVVTATICSGGARELLDCAVVGEEAFEKVVKHMKELLEAEFEQLRGKIDAVLQQEGGSHPMEMGAQMMELMQQLPRDGHAVAHGALVERIRRRL